jgi:hypothetical protein
MTFRVCQKRQRVPGFTWASSLSTKSSVLSPKDL